MTGEQSSAPSAGADLNESAAAAVSSDVTLDPDDGGLVVDLTPPAPPAPSSPPPPTSLSPSPSTTTTAVTTRRPSWADTGYWRLRASRLLSWPPSPTAVFSVVYVVLAVVITGKLLADPTHQVLTGNPDDQYYFEWQLGWVQHALFPAFFTGHGQNPLFSHAMNAPTGFNVLANPQILLPAAVLSPITWLAGAPTSFALLMAFNFAATAILWRWFLLRNGITSQTAAFLAGLFLGFAPSMVTHSLAHPDLASQWLIPVIVDRVLRLRTSDRVVRDGVVLGLLITAQLFTGEELLFLAAVGFGLFAVAYMAMHPTEVRRDGLRFLKGSAVAIGVAAVILAYPLTFQFTGNQSFTGIPFDIGWYSADLKSYLLVPNLSVWGDPAVLDPLAAGNTEQASFFGVGLAVVILATLIWCIRSPVVRAAIPALFVLVVLSLGPTPKYGRNPLPSPFGPHGIWQVVGKWPLFSSGLPIRMAMAVSWFVGILLAIGLERAMTHRWQLLRGAAVVGAVVALVPLTPRVYATNERPAVPKFFTDGTWKTCVTPDHPTIVTVPPSDSGDRTAMRWQTAAGLGYDIPMGAVFVPGRGDDRVVKFGTTDITWTASWLIWFHANGNGASPGVGGIIPGQVRADLNRLRATCVVDAADDPNLAAENGFLSAAVGPGQLVDGVWVWREPAS